MPPGGVVALRTALQGVLRRGAPDEELRRAVALFCAEARRRGMLAEQVLVTLKEVWSTLPEVRRRGRPQRDRALENLISAAIQTFYEPRPDGRVRLQPTTDDTKPR